MGALQLVKYRCWLNKNDLVELHLSCVAQQCCRITMVFLDLPTNAHLSIYLDGLRERGVDSVRANKPQPSECSYLTTLLVVSWTAGTVSGSVARNCRSNLARSYYYCVTVLLVFILMFFCWGVDHVRIHRLLHVWMWRFSWCIQIL